MIEKGFNKIQIGIKLLLIIVVLSTQFFSPNFIDVAHAAQCVFTINLDANPKSAPFNRPVSVTGNISLMGSTFNPPGTPDAGFCTDSKGSAVKKAYLNLLPLNLFPDPVTLNISASQLSPIPFSVTVTPSDKGYTAQSTVNIFGQVYDDPAFKLNSATTKAQSSPIQVNLIQGIYATYACVADNGNYACSPKNYSDCSDASACSGKVCSTLADSGQCGQPAPVKAPSVIFVPKQTSYAPGSTINITVSDLPSGKNYSVDIAINGKSPATISLPYLVHLDQSSNFKTDGTSNTIDIVINDSSGNLILTSPLSFVISSSAVGGFGASAGTAQGAANNTSSIDCKANPDSCVYNPLPTDNLKTLLLLIVNWLLGFIGVVAVIFIIIGGFQMVVSQGNEEAYGKAKKTVTWAIIGMAVALMAFSLIAIVQNILHANVQAPPSI